jgi:hypothetical protein
MPFPTLIRPILLGGIIGVPIIRDSVSGKVFINGFVQRIGLIASPIEIEIKNGNPKAAIS